MSDGTYGDMILKLSFLMPDDGVARDGNSGFFVRAFNNGGNNGLEAQVESVRDRSHWNATGSIYDLAQGQFGRFKYNDWNDYVIYIMGDRMVVYLNGEKTASTIVPVNAPGSFRTMNPGHIKIQSHAPYYKLQVKDVMVKAVE